MNCEKFLSLLGFDYKTSGKGSLKISMPATLCNDGQHLNFYLIELANGLYHITDEGETALHASQFGVELTKIRLENLNQTTGVNFAKVGLNGSITSTVSKDDVQTAIWDVIKLSLAISFNSKKWIPKFDQLKFRALVEKLLIQELGKDRVIKSIRTKGISGHTVEFPLAIKSKSGSSLYYIEPIALSESKIDWSHVYQIHGKFSDVKQADEDNNRLIIFENGANEEDFGRAATLLSQTASICKFSETKAVIASM